MENLTTNKKISLACAIGLVISFFLPYLSSNFGGGSLMDAAELTAKVWIWPLCGAAAAFLTFKDNFGMARIAFIVSLGFWIYYSFLQENALGMVCPVVAADVLTLPLTPAMKLTLIVALTSYSPNLNR